MKRLSLLLLLFSVSCGSNNEPEPVADCSTVTSTFAADVAPLIQASCAINSGCHGSGSLRGPGPLLNYQQVFAARNVIKAAVASGEMPQGATLSSDQKSKIVCWIEAGAADN